MLELETDIRYLKGVGEKKAEYLNSMGIDTVGALLRTYPRSYADFSAITDIFDCVSGEKVCIKATVLTEITEHRIRANLVLYKFDVGDNTGIVGITVFNNRFIKNMIHKGSTYLFCGKIEASRYKWEMSSPEILQEDGNSIHPIYKSSAKISSKQIEKLVKTAFENISEIKETLPENIIKKYRLMPLSEALKEVHFPKNAELLKSAKKRLVFGELFILCACLSLLKGKRKKQSEYIIKTDYSKEFASLLPYELTNAQKNVIGECLLDMKSGTVMNRLVEGDVGSGKTAVAASLMYTAAKNGIQSAIMAPTEILAEQHYKYLCETFKESNIKPVLLTGSLKKKERETALSLLKSGESLLAVGTHALITGDVAFKNLGLVITDEQHRFGVNQRAGLAKKGIYPHTLIMSATPIPRTLGLIIYGDLDISILDEYPKGRQKIETYAVSSDKRERVYNYIIKHLEAGLQGYIVCPMVEENEQTPVLSAEETYKKIKDTVFKNYSVGLLHGKMKPKEKESVMRSFKSGEIQLLVCTTVIEVGIDVPSAAIMVIENAERFGLSQLHQLRGRVGRGKAKSSCILISDLKGKSQERLFVIRDNNDGFKIAENDLKLRGPGDFLGNRQHGLPELKIADLYADGECLKLARMTALNTLEHDPKLNNPENKQLKAEIISLYKRLNEN